MINESGERAEVNVERGTLKTTDTGKDKGRAGDWYGQVLHLVSWPISFLGDTILGMNAHLPINAKIAMHAGAQIP